LKEEVLIIGCGEIGISLVNGWFKKRKDFSKKISHINILETNSKRTSFLKKKFKKKIIFLQKKKIKNIDKKFKYVFLSFKPKDLNSNLFIYRNFFDKKTVIFSVLAGKNITDIKKIFPINKNIIRVMLNTPIAFNIGTMVYYSLKNTLKKEDLFLLNLVGKTYLLKNENFFDLMTILIGSGPAFFYYLAEIMEKSAINHGFNKKLIREIIGNTFFGTANIINNLDDSFVNLRKKVTSKGGTTEVAINFLKKKKFEKIVHDSINQGIKKSKVLRYNK